MGWWADEKVALSNNKVLRQVSKATLSDRLKSLVNELIIENDDIIARAIKDRNEFNSTYGDNEAYNEINEIIEQEYIDNEETLSKLGKLK